MVKSLFVSRSIRSLAAWSFALALAPCAARADLVLSYEAHAVQSSLVSGVTTETFDGFATGAYSAPVATAVGTFSAGRVSVRPANVNGGAGGVGQYLSIGNTSGLPYSATLTLGATPAAQKYFGFWWSAADGANQVEIYSGGSLLATWNVATIFAAIGDANDHNPNPAFAPGSPGQPYVYMNIFATGGTTFDQLVFRNSPNTGFEMDNFSIAADAKDVRGTVIPGGLTIVPEPASIVSFGLLGLLGTVGLGLRRRATRA